MEHALDGAGVADRTSNMPAVSRAHSIYAVHNATARRRYAWDLESVLQEVATDHTRASRHPAPPAHARPR